jgi:lipopolysaccharide export system protein LptA
MKLILILFLMLGGLALRAQTNAAAAQEEIGLRAERFRYDGATRQLIYTGNVRATNAQGALSCERLTVSLPADSALGSHPTNAVAETNVVIVFVNKGDTNHLTCDRAIYDYSVMNNVTNETFTFTGHATNVSERVWMTGEPLVWDNVSGQFTGVNFEAHFKQPAGSGNSSNATPFHLLK